MMKLKLSTMACLAVAAWASGHEAYAQDGIRPIEISLGDYDADGEVTEEEEEVFEEEQPFTEWLPVISELWVLASWLTSPMPGPCTDTGVTWSKARVVHSGGLRCVSQTFTISLGEDEGNQVTATWVGCPMFIDIEMGHGKVVPKQGYRVLRQGEYPWRRQLYQADCAAGTCEPDGMPTDLPTFVEHWTEVECHVPGGGSGSEQGSGIE